MIMSAASPYAMANPDDFSIIVIGEQMGKRMLDELRWHNGQVLQVLRWYWKSCWFCTIDCIAERADQH